MLQKSDESKHGRNVLKEQSRKRSRAQMGTTQECLNKGRASAYSRFSIGCSSKIVDSVCKSNYRMELVKNSGFGYMLVKNSGFRQFCQGLHLVPSFFFTTNKQIKPTNTRPRPRRLAESVGVVEGERDGPALEASNKKGRATTNNRTTG
ncbi:hypothetical protein ACQJBY_049422 [Aegilops geniculata]